MLLKVQIMRAGLWDYCQKNMFSVLINSISFLEDVSKHKNHINDTNIRHYYSVNKNKISWWMNSHSNKSITRLDMQHPARMLCSTVSCVKSRFKLHWIFMAMNDIGALIFPNDASSSWPVTYNLEIIIWDDISL